MKNKKAPQGFEEALRRAFTMGKAHTLLLVAQERFGEVPPVTEKQIMSSEPEQLDHWLPQILQASRLSDVVVTDLDDVIEYLEEFQEEWQKVGFEEGYAEGFEQGFEEGRAQMLIFLLEQRFGSLARPARKRIASAQSDQLDRWARRFFEAESLDEVFAISDR